LFCYTLANSIECVLRELIMWSEISSEHPVVLFNIARFSRIKLGQRAIELLKKANQEFVSIMNTTRDILEQVKGTKEKPQLVTQRLIKCIGDFLRADSDFINTLIGLKEYGNGDDLWITIVEHIEEEQRYMHRLMETLMVQVHR
jgi:hypothetical protein